MIRREKYAVRVEKREIRRKRGKERDTQKEGKRKRRERDS